MVEDHLAVIAPDDAFRQLVRARYSARPEVADEIKDYSWFHARQLEGGGDYLAARQLLAELTDKIRAGAFGARGILNRDHPPVIIDPIELATGEFDIFAKVLDCGRRRYGDVHLSKRDFDCFVDPKIVPSKASVAGTRPVQATGRPTKHDWEGALIEMIRYVHDEGKPEIQADLTRAMQMWFQNVCGREPAESEIKRRSRLILDRLNL